jgi:4-amino-4-deoxy-L-arabinose transferase-like glycosyltransferase
VVTALAVLYPLAYVGIALARMRFPFELEWMEGGAVDHVRRIMEGHPLYVAPSLAFTPFIYPPLYFYAAALVAKLMGGAGFVPLRLLSFAASLVTMALIFLIVRQDSKRRQPAAPGSIWRASTRCMCAA